MVDIVCDMRPLPKEGCVGGSARGCYLWSVIQCVKSLTPHQNTNHYICLPANPADVASVM